jgi:hypothetical protein
VFTNDPELIADIVAIAKADSTHGLDDIPVSLRILAIRCLTSLCFDRNRIAQLLTSAGVSSHHDTLPSILRAQVSSLLSSQKNAFVAAAVAVYRARRQQQSSLKTAEFSNI